MNEKTLHLESPGLVSKLAILEQVVVPGGLFKYARHEQLGDDSWRDGIVDDFSDGNATYLPMKHPLWLLPGPPIDYDSDEALFREIGDFVKHHHELRDSRSYDVLASFSMMTWRIEEFDVVPYIDFLGPKGTGKTRGLELLQQLTYRGWLVTHPTSAVCFYVVDRFTPTLLADNYEFWPKETRRDLDGLFNAGYRRGMVVPRRPREGEGNGSELLVYKVYSPKALAGTREPVDSLASRCIRIRTSRNQAETPIEVDAEWGRVLRCKLLAYRFKHLESKRVPLDGVMNRYGRVGEIFLSPLAVAPNEEIRNRLADFERGVFEDQVEDEATSLDADVVKAILEKRDLAVDHRLKIRDVTEALNVGRDPGDSVSAERVGWITNRLGFRKVRMPDSKGSRAIRIDSELLQRLSCIYDTEPHTPPDPSDRQTARTAGELDKYTSDSSDSLTPKVGYDLLNNVTTPKTAKEPHNP
jgi:hypothetical protein